ncbi:hypothetical protein EDD86DRAFT_208201 [Gorgonomyces haynaldii]|nr:hypothetical protein EDD86DRAFT_208201 [Gorgonomyces haynaldii]
MDFECGIDEHWMLECSSYCNNDIKKIQQQILFGDLRDMVSKSCIRESRIETNKSGGLFQIMDVLDIGVSAYSQLSLINNGQPLERKILKLELCDGVETISGVELQPLDGVDHSIPLGTKVLLNHVQVRNKTCLLDNRTFKILGGMMPDLQKVPFLERYRLKLSNLLNIPPSSAMGAAREPSVREEPQRHPAVKAEPQRQTTVEDADFDEFDDDIYMQAQLLDMETDSTISLIELAFQEKNTQVRVNASVKSVTKLSISPDYGFWCVLTLQEDDNTAEVLANSAFLEPLLQMTPNLFKQHFKDPEQKQALKLKIAGLMKNLNAMSGTFTLQMNQDDIPTILSFQYTANA